MWSCVHDRGRASGGTCAASEGAQKPEASMRHVLARAVVVSALAVAPACGGGGGGDLDPDVVTNLPPGDGTGTAATGRYSMESVTTGCDGSCAIEVDGFVYSACDIGARQDEDAEVTQTDGALAIDVEDSDYVSQLDGGIDADGSFEVGGLVTQQGGEITITARSIGVLTGNTMIGTARLWIKGMGLDCDVDVDVEGTRN